MKNASVLITLFVFFHTNSYANNIQVTSATLTGQYPPYNITFVQFNMSWDNSWRDNINWDAAWVFVKFKASYDTTWRHAFLSTSATYHIIQPGYTVEPTPDGLGVLIYRTNNGNGTVNLTNVMLRWEYGLNGLNDADQVQVKVFAIEMVYIPQGVFYAGDGTTNNVAGQFSQGNTTNPFLITGEGALTLGGSSTSNLGNRNTAGENLTEDFNFTTTQTLPAAYPKGYNPFYCMKYEISQSEYTEFLNTLTRTQQRTRVASDISGDIVTNIYVMSNTPTLTNRNRITCPASGNGTTSPITFSCDRPDRACNFLTWMDGAAYMDWAGLRPMTDLEFEKACRGPLTPVADEFAWGNTTVVAASTISGTENGTETITTPNANCSVNNINFTGGDGGQGPLRCGIFATGTSTRTSSGASYYGVMDMSGGLSERNVSMGSPQARAFTGLHGDGILSSLGNANVSNWPGLVNGEVTGAIGSGLRGGAWPVASQYSRTSDRSSSNLILPDRWHYYGFRGVRTSPSFTLSPNKN